MKEADKSHSNVLPSDQQGIVNIFVRLIQSGVYGLNEGYKPHAWISEGRIDRDVWDTVIVPRSVALYLNSFAVTRAVITQLPDLDPETRFAAKYALLELMGHAGYSKLNPHHEPFFIGQFVNRQREHLSIERIIELNRTVK